jgi:predicted RNA-binding protein with PIN domain
LIARLDDLALDDPDDEAKLVLRLRSWTAASKKRRVTVIFDGGLPGGRSRQLSTSRITVLFASSGQTADDLLIRRINQLPNPAEYTLVTSDREVIAAARKRRISLVPSEEFAAQLPRARPRAPGSQVDIDDQKTAATSRETPELSEAEISEWLELFGPVPERKAATPTSPTPAETIANKPPTHSRPAKPDIGRVDRERKLSAEEIDEWLRLFRHSQ